MKTQPTSTDAHSEPDHYEIRIRGHLENHWADWFDGLTITLDPNGETLLAGPVADQAALHGLLRKVRDLGLSLISVIQVEQTQTFSPDDNDHSQSTEETKP